MKITKAFLQSTLDRVQALSKRQMAYEQKMSEYRFALIDYKNLPENKRRLTTEPSKPARFCITAADKASLKRVQAYIEYHIRQDNVEDLHLAKQVMLQIL